MNDRVLQLTPGEVKAPIDPLRFRAVSLPYVIKLGQEMFAEAPLLHREDLERASRLALLIHLKSPDINAALFAAPSAGCRPDQVAARFAAVSMEVMATLYTRERDVGVDAVAADRQVWRRLAA